MSPASREREFALRGARAALEANKQERRDILELFPELAVDPTEVFFNNTPSEKMHVRDAVAKMLTGTPKRQPRQHSAELKKQLLAKLRAGEYAADLARKHGLHPSLLSEWAKKAGVELNHMPHAEIMRRRHAATPADQQLTDTAGLQSLTYSDRIGFATLRALVRHGGPSGTASSVDLATRENVVMGNMTFRLDKRLKLGHVVRVRRGVFRITKEGRAWYDKLAAAGVEG